MLSQTVKVNVTSTKRLAAPYQRIFPERNVGIKVYVGQDKYFSNETERFIRKVKLLGFVFNI